MQCWENKTQSIPHRCLLSPQSCLIWNSHSSVQKLQEVGVIAAWDTVSLNIWLVHGGFSLWLDVNTVVLAGAVRELDGEGGEQLRGQMRPVLQNSGVIQVSCFSPTAFKGLITTVWHYCCWHAQLSRKLCCLWGCPHELSLWNYFLLT